MQKISELFTKEEIDKYKVLMLNNNNYPSPSESDFQYKIYKKKEFYNNKIPSRGLLTEYKDIKEYRDNVCARDFALREQQTFLANFINPDTPYKGLLIFHGVGTGKTCGAIAIAEKFKPMLNRYNTQVVVLVPGPSVKSNWKNELIKCTGNTYRPLDYNEMDKDMADKIALNSIFQYYKLMSYATFYKKVLGEKILEKTVKDNKVKLVYKKNEKGEFERTDAIDKIYHLNNTLIIIDEAHHLTDNEHGEALKKIISASTNLKVLLLTATPMKNLADDIVDLLNFIRPENKKIKRNKVFSVHKNYEMEFKPDGAEYLRRKTTGYVSYLRGNDPLIFATRNDMGVIPEEFLFTSIIRCKMSKFQLRVYNSITSSLNDSLDKKTSAISNFVFPGLQKNGKTYADALDGYFGNDGLIEIKKQLSEYQQIINEKIGPDILSNNSDNSNFLVLNNKQLTGDIFKLKYLKNFSIKFYTALLNLQKLIHGTAFIFSNLVKVGIELFQTVLLQNGYLEYQPNYNNYHITSDTICCFCGKPSSEHNNNNHDFKPATFLSITGSTNDQFEASQDDKQQIIRNVFNNIANKDGSNIKFLLGSQVLAEGITLENVREVHILDAYYNLNMVDQIIGRAIRNCKHYNITDENNPFPTVDIYKYAISMDDGLTTEEKLYKKSELKYILMKQVERILKETAVDCPLNTSGNIFLEDMEKYKDCVPGSKDKDKACPAICDYMRCEYKCYDKKLNDLYYDPANNNYKPIKYNKLDNTTFTNLLSTGDIDFAKNKIKEMYRTKYIFQLEQIVSYVYNAYPDNKKELFELFYVYKALNSLVPLTENDFNNFKDMIIDKYGVHGYLIQRNKYYIFQPFEQSEYIPMYYRESYNKILTRQFELYKYIKNMYDDDFDIDNNKLKALNTYKYDFDATEKYYNNREEYEFVGIIDLEATSGNATSDAMSKDAKDVFKIREKRNKLLDKKRGKGIQSLKGSVCTTKSKEYIANVCNKLGIKIASIMRQDMCEAIKTKLLHLEKYATDKNKDKFTYIIIPSNHRLYKFPYNLEDRIEYIEDTIKHYTKSDLKINVDKKIDKKSKLPSYVMTTNIASKKPELLEFIGKMDGTFDKKTNELRFIID
jgi:superfamily II DNA or RNA helicase